VDARARPAEQWFADFQTAVPFERSFDALYGMGDLWVQPGATAASVDVGPRLLGAGGAVPGGVYAALAESLASMGTAAEVVPQGLAASGLSNATHVLAEVRDGTLRGEARCLGRGTEWLWAVEVRDGHGALCAQSTVVIAVRPLAS
jgi:uncharacterized protein (TIGR00369 family)